MQNMRLYAIFLYRYHLIYINLCLLSAAIVVDSNAVQFFIFYRLPLVNNVHYVS